MPPLRVELAEGDLSTEQVDAVVNAANNHFWMGAGVAGALKARGGPEIEREAMARGPVEPGRCVVTPGFRLAARYVVHAAVMGQDLRTSGPVIEAATRCALDAADALGAASIAFPALGTGVGGFPMAECAGLMLGVIKAFAPRATSVRMVRFVLFGNASYRTAAGAAGEVLGKAVDGPADCPLSS
ncbi:MAG TPA: macro domain-containing protein [Vicinamibacterales bacterium]|nr:macro domain-containing protein [Vicinamibacterales bacterium]